MHSKPTSVDGTSVDHIVNRTRELLGLDDTGAGPVSVLGTHPRGVRLSEFERDLQEWGFVYGMVFAMLRAQDPWESVESVAKRALMPAWAVYTDWSGDIKRPDRDELVKRTVKAYRYQESRAPLTVELEDALIDLHNGCGA